MKKKVLIAGAGFIGNGALGGGKQFYDKHDKLITIIRDKESMETIQINGVTYAKNQPKKTSNGKSSRLFSILAAAQMMSYSMPGTGSSYSRKRPNVNIPEEYELIQNKKSKLCRSDRNWVEYMFESNYTKVEDINK